MKIYLFDSPFAHDNLLPLSFTRPLADFRCGILTIREKWERLLPGDYGYYPVEYLRAKFGDVEDADEEAIFIAGNLLPSDKTVGEIKALASGEFIPVPLTSELEQSGSSDPLDYVTAFRGSLSALLALAPGKISASPDVADTNKEASPEALSRHLLTYVYDIFLRNGEEIKKDFKLLTEGRESQPLPQCVLTLSCPAANKAANGSSHKNVHNYEIFIEKGATVECATINTTEGPVYIGKDAVLMEGACIRGPFALCEGAEVRMGAKIYEATTIGPHCKAGGEIANAVFFGFSNKSHDGYLGNAVIGEWCNIGAGTNASNLKNDYSLIRLWNYRTGSFMRTSLQFCGLIMGDHSKIGVNCMINTATVLGVGVNIHGAGFPRSFIPCFCEGSPGSGFTQVPLKKFLETAKRVMSRRDLTPSDADISILEHIYNKQ